jgi:hypothetical protein
MPNYVYSSEKRSVTPLDEEESAVAKRQSLLQGPLYDLISAGAADPNLAVLAAVARASRVLLSPPID